MQKAVNLDAVTYTIKLADDDEVWSRPCIVDDLYFLLASPHLWVNQKVRVPARGEEPERPAVLAENYVVLFEDVPTGWTNQPNNDLVPAILINGIDGTSIIHVQVPDFFSGALANLQRSDSAIPFFGDSRSFIGSFASAMERFTGDPGTLIKAEAARFEQMHLFKNQPQRIELSPVVQIIETDNASACHVQLGDDWARVAMQIWLASCAPQSYLDSLSMAKQQLFLPEEGVFADLDENDNRQFIAPYGSRIRFVFQGKELSQARTASPIACNINSGSIVTGNVTVVHTIAVKSYAMPTAPPLFKLPQKPEMDVNVRDEAQTEDIQGEVS